MDDSDDRRRATRVRVVGLATVQTGGALNRNDQALCTVIDVSRSGIGVETGQPPLLGQKVQLRIALDDRIHEIPGRTTRVQRRGDTNFFRVGFDWSDCSSEQLAFLDEILAAVERAPQG
jgi:hypothetical protein